jgi:hypothetical protein
MRIFLLAAGLLLLACTLAHAADAVTIDLGGTPVVLAVNATNKAMLTRMLTRENTRRAAQAPPLAALTLEEFVRDLVIDMVRGYRVQSVGLDHIDACTKFKTLTAAQQNTIITTLNGNSPCPP